MRWEMLAPTRCDLASIPATPNRRDPYWVRVYLKNLKVEKKRKDAMEWNAGPGNMQKLG
jgi:hypothetical protein